MLSTPIPLAPQTERSHNGAYRKEKRRGKVPSFSLSHVSDIQILQCKCIIGTNPVHYTLQTKCLIILVVIIFGAEVFTSLIGV